MLQHTASSRGICGSREIQRPAGSGSLPLLKAGRRSGPKCVVKAARDDAEAAIKGAERRRRMLAYVREVEPAAVLEEFLIKESPVVVGAMRQTISNMLGTITATPQFFTVTISTVGENLAMLMNTVMLTGYMFKSAEERYRLRTALGPSDAEAAVGPAAADGAVPAGPAAAAAAGLLAGGSSSSGSNSGSGSGGGSGSIVGGGSGSSILDEGQYAPGVQKSRVQGEVLMWHKEKGLESMDAVAYIELLEAEVLRLRAAAAPAPKPPRLPPAAAWGLPPAAAAAADPTAAALQDGAAQQRPLPALRQQSALAVRPHDDRNELLEFIRALEPGTVSDLTACATPETAAAMDAFVERLLGLGGAADRDALRRAASETQATEMRQLLFWLLVVGWQLRALEVQIELERSLE